MPTHLSELRRGSSYGESTVYLSPSFFIITIYTNIQYDERRSYPYKAFIFTLHRSNFAYFPLQHTF